MTWNALSAIRPATGHAWACWGCERCHTPDTLHNVPPHSEPDACAVCHGAPPDRAFSVGPLPPALYAVRPSSNVTGSLVSLVGENNGAVQDGGVTFGTTPGTVTLWSETEISATVPSSLDIDNYPVTVTQTQRGASNHLNLSVLTDSPEHPAYQKLTCANCHYTGAVSLHGFTNPDFKACVACHKLHIETPGGPDCISCHGVGKMAPKHIDTTVLGQSIHARLNATAVNSTANVLNVTCWACHGDGSQPTGRVHPARYDTPKVCTDCHIELAQYGAPLVSEHFKSGTDLKAVPGASTDVLSCITCHEGVSGMVLANADEDTGSFDADGSGTRGGANSPYHYGKPRTDLVSGNVVNCAYCHQDPANVSGFDGVFANSLNSNMERHPHETTPGAVACTSCHNTGRMHDATLQKPFASSAYCQTCHPSKADHNGRVTCIQCHTTNGNTRRDIHGIRFITSTVTQPGGTWLSDRTGAATCETCHQGAGLTVDGFGVAPKVPEPVQHSNDNGGRKWGTYWTTDGGACTYCHGDTRHQEQALGKVEQVRTGRTLRAPLIWDSDGDGVFGENGNESTRSCPTCHNVHGSTYRAMLRDGQLEGKTGLQLGVDTKYPSEGSYVIPYGSGTCEGLCHTGWSGGYTPRRIYWYRSSTAGTGECGVCHAATNSTLTTGSHPAHLTAARGPNGVDTSAVSCNTCHGDLATEGRHAGHMNGVKNFAEGDTFSLSATSVCNTCHSPGGTFDGVNNASLGAKNNWNNGVYSGSELAASKAQWCITCHDDVPAVVNGESAPNTAGDNSGYGYYVTGHGLDRAAHYARMYYQGTSGTGNPGADQVCTACHDNATTHIMSGANPTTRRLKSGYANNDSNDNCNRCHPPGNVAVAPPELYTNSGEYEAAGHGGRLCTECHDIHGTIGGAFPAMARNSARELCLSCHFAGNTYGAPVPSASRTEHGSSSSTPCSNCHNPHKPHHGGGAGGTGCGDANSCHGTRESHTTHVSGVQLALQCSECHNTSNFPQFKDGQDKAGTHVCDNCHTTNGVALAKQYWDYPGSSSRAAGSWAVVEGEKSFCGSCHDSTPGNTRENGSGDTAFNVVGDDQIYGFYVTGHGKPTGNYASMSRQDRSAVGNPAANLARCSRCHGIPPVDDNGWPNPPFPPTPAVTPCSFCHDLQTTHFNNTARRLRAGFENDQNNTNCKRCHSYNASEGTAASNAPHFYTTSADYENSAHKNKLCTDCHDVHGAAGAYTGMAKADKESLCYQCHKDPAQGGVQNNAISGSTLADDIPQAFSMSYKHDLGTSLTVDGKTYTLQCTTCHNVHIVTGKYWDAAQGKSPVTRLTNNTSLWGAASGEKMSDYASSGTYQTPNGDPFAGNILPDYVTFCADCHNNVNTIYSGSLGRNLYKFDPGTPAATAQAIPPSTSSATIRPTGSMSRDTACRPVITPGSPASRLRKTATRPPTGAARTVMT